MNNKWRLVVEHEFYIINTITKPIQYVLYTHFYVVNPIYQNIPIIFIMPFCHTNFALFSQSNKYKNIHLITYQLLNHNSLFSMHVLLFQISNPYHQDFHLILLISISILMAFL